MIFDLFNQDVVNENHLYIANKIFYVIDIKVIYKNIWLRYSSDLSILKWNYFRVNYFNSY